MPMFAASLESLLVFAVIILLSALSNWLKQRKEQESRRKQGKPTPVQARGHPTQPAPVNHEVPPPARPTDWQEELRRLLAGETEAPPAPPPALPPAVPSTPPPVPARETTPASRPSPAPPVLAPAPFLRRTSLPVPSSVEAPVLIPPGSHLPPEAEELDAEPAPTFVLAPLQTSAAAYGRASQLDDETAAHMQDVVRRTEQAMPADQATRHTALPAETALVLAQLRHPRTARQAVLASMILGPPKALEPENPVNLQRQRTGDAIKDETDSRHV